MPVYKPLLLAGVGVAYGLDTYNYGITNRCLRTAKVALHTLYDYKITLDQVESIESMNEMHSAVAHRILNMCRGKERLVMLFGLAYWMFLSSQFYQ
jgi:hypothetical protein